MSATSDYLFSKYQRSVLTSGEVCNEIGVTEEGLASLIKEKALSPLPGPDMRFPIPALSRYLEGAEETTTPDTAPTAPAVALPDTLGVQDLMAVLKIGRSLAYRLIDRGELRCIRVGRSIRIPRMYLEEYLENPAKERYAHTRNGATSDLSNERRH